MSQRLKKSKGRGSASFLLAALIMWWCFGTALPAGYGQQEDLEQSAVVEVHQGNLSEEAKPEVSQNPPRGVPEDEAFPETDAIKVTSEGTTSPGNVSLDFKEADILNVLRVLSLKSGVNIVAGPEVQGIVTIRLQDVPWQKALEVVLRTYGYIYEREGNIIRVTTKENLSTEELLTETFVLNYTTAAEVESAIKEILSERGRVKSVPRTNTVIVTDIPTNLYKISEVIKSLDKSTPQVYIDAKIISTELGQNETLGVDWNTTGKITGSARPVTFPFTAPGRDVQANPLNNQILSHFYPGPAAVPSDDRNSAPVARPTNASPTAFSFGTLSFTDFSALMTFLRQKSNTKIISNPRIVVLNHQTAKVQVGEQIPIPTFERNETSGSFNITGFNYRDVGIVLNVTPHINNSSEILVEVKPEVSSKGDDVDFGGSGFKAPSFNATVAQTQVLIRDTETIAIGGLSRDAKKVAEDSIPGLSKIPLIGRIFRSHTMESGSPNQRKETLFFITVTIVDTRGQSLLSPTVTRGPAIASPKPAASSIAVQQKTV